MTGPSTVKRLSVAILVRDAAEPLRLTLASIRDVGHEIVVVDTGSTDKSRDVAREFGARVVNFEWSDDFAAARNFASAQVTGQWVLWIDAGETMSDADGRALQQFVETSAHTNCAYLLLIRVPAVDPQSADEQIGCIRLVPHRPGLTFVGRVRESLTEAVLASGMQVGAAPFMIRRGERDHDARLKKQRAQRNIRLAEQEQRERGNSARLWNCIGDACHTLGEFQRAADCFRQGLSTAARGSAEMLESYYGLLTSLDGLPSGRETQLPTCIEALELFPLDAQLLCALGGYLHVQGHPQLAIKAYLTAYKFGQVQPTVWHVAEIRDVAAVCYSISLQLQQRQEEAAQFLEESLREQGDSVRLRRRLIDIYINGGQRDVALAHVAALPSNTPQKEALRSAVRGACYAVQKNWLAAKAYLQAALGHGCRDPLCYKWLSISLLAGGETVAARPILEQWQLLEPRNGEPTRLLAIVDQRSAQPPSDRQLRVDSAAPALSGNSIPLDIAAQTRASISARQ